MINESYLTLFNSSTKIFNVQTNKLYCLALYVLSLQLENMRRTLKGVRSFH